MLFQTQRISRQPPGSSHSHSKFFPWPVLPRMFPEFIFSQDLCQLCPPWQGGHAEEALAFLQAPALGTRTPGSAHPPARQIKVALVLMTSCKPTTIFISEEQFLSFSCLPVSKHSPHLFSWYQTKILGSAPEYGNVLEVNPLPELKSGIGQQLCPTLRAVLCLPVPQEFCRPGWERCCPVFFSRTGFQVPHPHLMPLHAAGAKQNVSLQILALPSSLALT